MHCLAAAFGAYAVHVEEGIGLPPVLPRPTKRARSRAAAAWVWLCLFSCLWKNQSHTHHVSVEVAEPGRTWKKMQSSQASTSTLAPPATAATSRAPAASGTRVDKTSKGEQHMVCGATAGLVATMLLHPLDLIKTRFHVQEHGSKRLPHYGGVLDACRSIARLEGWRGFYGGLLPNLVGNTASWGVYMYSYNASRRRFHSAASQALGFTSARQRQLGL